MWGGSLWMVGIGRRSLVAALCRDDRLGALAGLFADSGLAELSTLAP
jgi:hypothetical protein